MSTFEQLVMIAGLMCTFILPIVVGRRLMPARQRHVIRPGFITIYIALCCIFIGLFAGLLGGLGDIFHRELEQRISWAGVVASLVLGGAALLAWSLGARLVIGGGGLEPHMPLRGVRTVAWSDIRTIRLMRNYDLAVMGAGRRLCTLPATFAHLEVFLEDCEARGIPLLR